MAKTKLERRGRIDVDYADVSMWVIPSLREASQNLPTGAPERRKIGRIITSLARKETSATAPSMDASI